MIYFTSDLHIGQSPDTFRIPRPFSCAEEMNETLINNWNSCVKNDDLVYVLGDLFSHDIKNAESYLCRLNGEKILIVGNHDHVWMDTLNLNKYFKKVALQLNIREDFGKCVLCHYPMMSWEGFSKCAFHIHGHIHNYCHSDYWPLLHALPYALNAGVDVNNYAPAHILQLITNNAEVKSKHPAGKFEPKSKEYWEACRKKQADELRANNEKQI